MVNPPRIKVLLITESIPSYRKPIYEELANTETIELSIIHTNKGDMRKGSNYDVMFYEKLTSSPIVILKNFRNDIVKQFDVVIAMFNPRWINLVGLVFYCNNKKIPLVLWGHGYGKSKLIQLLRNYLINKSTALLLYHEGSRKEFINNGILAEKVYAVNNTIRINNTSFNKNIKRDRFLFVGRIQKRKRIEDALYAFERAIVSSKMEVYFDIVGEGELLTELKNLSAQLNIKDRVIFHGDIRDENRLKDLFQKSLAYVSPGDVGLGVLHSFAYGVPVITSKNAWHGPEFKNINESNSIVYDGSISNLTKEMVQLTLNKEQSYTLGAQAFDLYINHRTSTKMVSGFIDVINYAIKKQLT